MQNHYIIHKIIHYLPSSPSFFFICFPFGRSMTAPTIKCVQIVCYGAPRSSHPTVKPVDKCNPQELSVTTRKRVARHGYVAPVESKPSV